MDAILFINLMPQAAPNNGAMTDDLRGLHGNIEGIVNAIVHAQIMTIMVQETISNTRPIKILRYKNKMLNLVIPNAAFSTIWKIYSFCAKY